MTQDKDPFSYIVLGAGPAGLGTAYRLSSAGRKVLVLEKEDSCGGLSQTLDYRNCRTDFGPHILHTRKTEIIDFLREALGDDLLQRKVRTQIYIRNKFVPYPIKGLRVITALDFFTALRATWDLVIARTRLALSKAPKDPSFMQWIIRRFGKTIYGIYFGPYAEKVWALTGMDISAYVAIQRVPVFSFRDYLRRLIELKPKQFHKEDAAFVKCFYPRYGIGQVITTLKTEIEKKGGRIQTHHAVSELRLSGSRIAEVATDQGDAWPVAQEGRVFSSLPVNRLIGMIRPAPPADVRQAAEALDFCAARFLYLAVKKQDVFNATLTYFQDPSIPFNRITSLRHLSVDCVPADHDVLCVEFTCMEGDPIWTAPDEALYQKVMNVFTSLNLLRAEDVSFYYSRQVPFAYPRFRVGFEKRMRVIFSYLKSIENLVVLGRQGLFCYANVDEVLAMSFEAVDSALSPEKGPFRYWDTYKESFDVAD